MADAPEFPDWLAIRELTARYNRAFDEADVEGWGDTFVPGGRLAIAPSGPVYEGREALSAFIRDRGWGFLHMTLDPQIELTATGARQQCNLLLFGRSAARRTPELINTGRYDDELVRTPDGWRFACRTVEMDSPPGRIEVAS
jgi:hypothetical protein